MQQKQHQDRDDCGRGHQLKDAVRSPDRGVRNYPVGVGLLWRHDSDLSSRNRVRKCSMHACRRIVQQTVEAKNRFDDISNAVYREPLAQHCTRTSMAPRSVRNENSAVKILRLAQAENILPPSEVLLPDHFPIKETHRA